MNWSSYLSILILFLACGVSVFTLATEEPDKSYEPTFRKKWRKKGLLVFAIGIFIVGVWQVSRLDKENKDASKTHENERKQDSDQISNLSSSVNTLSSQNQKQSEQLSQVSGELEKLKLETLSENEKKTIESLEKELAPKPKANLIVGFFTTTINGSNDIPKRLSILPYPNVAKFRLVIFNPTDVDAKAVTVYVRICQLCKFHTEPPMSIKPNTEPNLSWERQFNFGEMQPKIGYNDILIEMDVPPMVVTPVQIDVRYRCPDCVVEKEQQLWADVK